MLDQFNESDLLSLIEGDLSAEQSDVLWESLRTEPHAYQVVKAMCEDRNLLRSLEEPRVPAGILEALEPQLARPMLMAPTNADLRYKGRQTKRRNWLPIAAGIGLILMTVAWAVFSGLFSGSNDFPANTVVSNNGDETNPTSDDIWRTRRESASDDLNPIAVAPGSTIHHYGPVDVSTIIGLASNNAPSTNNGSTQLIAADFALVLSCDDEDIELALQAALNELSTQTALVRNFSFAEARRLADDWAVAAANRRNTTEPDFRTASVDEANSRIRSRIAREFQTLANRARNQLKLPKRQPVDPKSISKQLSGPKQLAPSFEQQLTYSMHGAAYTIAIPSSKLNEILSSLQQDPSRSTTLKMLTLDKNRESEAPKISLPTLADYTLARNEADRLIHSGVENIILLPIIIN